MVGFWIVPGERIQGCVISATDQEPRTTHKNSINNPQKAMAQASIKEQPMANIKVDTVLEPAIIDYRTYSCRLRNHQRSYYPDIKMRETNPFYADSVRQT